jgi:hypothetical protein
MPGEPYQVGGLRQGIPTLVASSKSFIAESLDSVIKLGHAIERRGSTMPLLRRLSIRVRAPSLPNEYEAIPLHRPNSAAPTRPTSAV